MQSMLASTDNADRANILFELGNLVSNAFLKI